MSRQKGQVLLEFVVAISLLTLLSVWGASQWGLKVQRAKIDAMASWLMDLRRAANLSSEVELAAVRADLGDTQRNGVERLIDELKRQARLPMGFSIHAPMDYQVSLIPVLTEHCQASPCLNETLLVAVPVAENGLGQAQTDALDLLLALQGQGATVLASRPGFVKGPGMQYDLVKWQGQLLPAGSVALLLWGAAQALPYVRLNEDRPVALNGYVNFGSTARFEQLVHADQGLVVGKTATEGAACQAHNQLALMAGGGMALCQAGHWSVMQQAHRFKACDSVVQRSTDVYQQGLILASNMGSMAQTMADQCLCSPGFIARYLGVGARTFNGVTISGGFLCESL